MQDRAIISSTDAAAIFASARQRLIVQLLINAELSLGALAQATQMPMSLLHYHVSKCLAAGLIQVIREQRRAGRAIKYYRATAKSFFVPTGYIATLPGTGLAQQLRDSLEQNLAQTLSGVEFTHDGQSPLTYLRKEVARRGVAVELWLDIGLSSADSEELFATLQSVADRFRARASGSDPRYLVHLAAVKM